jgi:hypothetical protein
MVTIHHIKTRKHLVHIMGLSQSYPIIPFQDLNIEHYICLYQIFHIKVLR